MAGSYPLPLQPGASGSTYIPADETFKILTAKPAVRFLSAAVQPPSRVYIGLNDRFLVNFHANFINPSVTVRGRVLTPDGQIGLFERIFNAFPGTVFGSVEFTLAECFLLSLTIQDNTIAGPGLWNFATVDLEQSHTGPTNAFERLIADYIGVSQNIAGWPENPTRQPFAGLGTPRAVFGTAQAAGVEVSDTVPVGVRWFVQSIRLLLRTNVAAGTRQPVLVISDNAGNQLFAVGCIFGQVPSSLQQYVFGPGGVDRSGALFVSNTAVDGFFMESQWKILTVTSGFSGGDQYDAPVYVVREYRSPWG